MSAVRSLAQLIFNEHKPSAVCLLSATPESNRIESKRIDAGRATDLLVHSGVLGLIRSDSFGRLVHALLQLVLQLFNSFLVVALGVCNPELRIANRKCAGCGLANETHEQRIIIIIMAALSFTQLALLSYSTSVLLELSTPRSIMLLFTLFLLLLLLLLLHYYTHDYMPVAALENDVQDGGEAIRCSYRRRVAQ